jgi:hypothetical protein
MFARGIEDARDLFRRKRNLLAERIDCLGEARCGDLRKLFSADPVDVAMLVGLRFRRQRMGAEKGAYHGDVPLSAEPCGGVQHLRFVVGIEAVAGLDLDRRHAFRDQRIEPW